MPETYWATLPPDKLATEVMSRWKDWRQYFWMSGIGIKADKGRRYYYGLNDLGDTSSRPNVGGTASQYLRVVLNKVRPIVQRTFAMIAARAATMTPVAANSDAAAREQAVSSKGILEHVHRVHDVDAIDFEVLKMTGCMGEAWRMTTWDATAGEVTAVEESGDGTRTPTDWSGDIRYDLLSPFDVARDPSARDQKRLPWIIARTYENRWELAAKYPEKADRILAAREHDYASLGSGYDLRLGVQDIVSRGDAVPVFHFFHLDGRAIPGGRAFTCLNEGTWLTDGANPYEGLPVEPCFADKVISTTMGYSNIFDALGIADMLNAMETTIFTHTVRWGTRPIIDFVGSGLQHSTLGNGTSVLTVKDKDHIPIPLDVPPIPPEVFKHLEELERHITEALGMNETAMGNPPFSGMPAQLAALLDQKAQEFNDGLSKSWTTYKQGCATKELKILQRFADEPRIATIQGKAKQWMLKTWNKDALSKVSLVAFEPQPPGTGSVSWKIAMVELLQRMSPEQLAAVPLRDLINLLRTGELESPFEADEANRLRIKSENEGLLEGRVPPIIIARTHWVDIPEHLALLSPPDIAEKPEVVNAVLTTVEQKLAAWRSMPPDLLALLGGPPPPMPVIAPALPAGTPNGAPPVPPSPGGLPQ